MGNMPSTLTSLAAVARVDDFSPSTCDPVPDSGLDIPVQAGDVDIEYDTDSARSFVEIIHPCGSTTDPIRIVTSSLPDSASSTNVSPFSESYDSFPDPELFPSSASESGSSLIWSTPSQYTGSITETRTRRTRKRTTSLVSCTSVSSTSTRASIGERIGERLSHSLPKVSLQRTPRIDGRRWVVGSPEMGSPLGERKAIRVGYPFYEEVAAKVELERERSVRGRVRRGLGMGA